MAISQSKSRPRPVLIVMSTLTALQVLVGGAALGDVIGLKAAGLAVLVVAAIGTGMAFYVQGQVTPLADPVDERGRTLVPEGGGGVPLQPYAG